MSVVLEQLSIGETGESASLSIDLKPLETLVARTDVVAMGRFFCPSSHELFRDSGPCSYHTIVFPRTVTAVRRDDDAAFVADPTTVIFYNQNQNYTRSKVSEVDECNWFVVADDILFDVLAKFGASVDESHDRPFEVPFVSADPSLYLAQQRLFDRVESDESIGPDELDEAVVELLEAVIRRLSLRERSQSKTRHAVVAAERVESVKRAIAADIAETLSLRELATIAECSPFELCRSFREVTGMRITEYRNELRTRAALAKLRGGCSDLADLALELGFSSHSHFTAKFRRAFGMPPSAWRAMG